MNPVTLSEPVSLSARSAELLRCQGRSLNFKLAHLQAGLCCRDLAYLDAPLLATRKGLTFRGVSIE